MYSLEYGIYEYGRLEQYGPIPLSFDYLRNTLFRGFSTIDFCLCRHHREGQEMWDYWVRVPTVDERDEFRRRFLEDCYSRVAGLRACSVSQVDLVQLLLHRELFDRLGGERIGGERDPALQSPSSDEYEDDTDSESERDGDRSEPAARRASHGTARGRVVARPDADDAPPAKRARCAPPPQPPGVWRPPEAISQ
jgi:hypothetical protein